MPFLLESSKTTLLGNYLLGTKELIVRRHPANLELSKEKAEVAMGKEISHIILAEQSAGSLEDSGKDPFVSVLRKFPHAFHFGSIAADTFFYGIRVPFLEMGFACCGDKIHGTDGNDTSLPLLGCSMN
jgi:hypothetical protein